MVKNGDPEIFDRPDVLELKVKKLAEMVRESKGKCVLFTGAGISTSAGIPDFRGPNGVWTLKDKGLVPKRSVDASQAAPTLAHMEVKSLVDRGVFAHVVSQNVDGIHRRSGLSADRLSELHGNTNLERCDTCGREYFRDMRTRRAGNHVHDHFTGRKCDCGGKLMDSIVNFGENLPEREWIKADRAFGDADLCVVLGSSCRVTPAASLPEQFALAGKRLVIVNLQETPLDELADLLIHARTDDVMKILVQHLQDNPKAQTNAVVQGPALAVCATG